MRQVFCSLVSYARGCNSPFDVGACCCGSSTCGCSAGCACAASTRRKASTTWGSNCVPAQRSSSALAEAAGKASRYGLCEVIGHQRRSHEQQDEPKTERELVGNLQVGKPTQLRISPDK